MCLILFSWNPNTADPLIVAANRDEFYRRPSQNAHLWPESALSNHLTQENNNTQVIAGKDLEQQGTWIGITQDGRFAAVTNYRKPDKTQYPLSRGALTSNFLNGRHTPKDYLDLIQQDQNKYAGFNLLVGDRSSLYYYSNRSDQPPQCLDSGTYGLSNHLLNSPWPKVTTGIDGFSDILNDTTKLFSEKESALLVLLQNDKPADDSTLPETGVGVVIEKLLSPLFIRSPEYGTRASTIIRIQQSGEVSLVEQNYIKGGKPADKIVYRF